MGAPFIASMTRSLVSSKDSPPTVNFMTSSSRTSSSSSRTDTSPGSQQSHPPCTFDGFRITLASVLRVHSSALNHGCTIEDISHAVDMALYETVLDDNNDPPKLLII